MRQKYEAEIASSVYHSHNLRKNTNDRNTEESKQNIYGTHYSIRMHGIALAESGALYGRLRGTQRERGKELIEACIKTWDCQYIQL